MISTNSSVCSIVPLQGKLAVNTVSTWTLHFAQKLQVSSWIFKFSLNQVPSAESFSVSPNSTRNNCFTRTICAWHFLKSWFLVPKPISEKRIKELHNILPQFCLYAIFLSLFQSSQRLFHTLLRGKPWRKATSCLYLFFPSCVLHLVVSSGSISRALLHLTFLIFSWQYPQGW